MPSWVTPWAFHTGTAAEIISVTNIDRRTIGDGTPGRITGELCAAFRKHAAESGTPIK